MRRAGSVVRITQGLLVVRAADAEVPSIGTAMLDENLEEVGHVVDVFGPTGAPYLAVTPRDGVHAAGLLQAPLYHN